jgi:L-fucose isomerase-like protein
MPDGGRRAAPEGRSVMGIVDRPVCFGVIVGTRGFFNPALASEGRKKLLGVVDAMGFTHVLPDERATPHGAIECRADAFCGKLSVCNNLRQYRIPWTDTTQHSCAVDGAEL